jgi:hypothetical protein
MSKRNWPDDDANEYDDLVTEALRESTTAGRTKVFLAGLDDATQAQRYWALDVTAEIRGEGASRILKREAAQRRPRVAVSDGGEIIGRMPREVGRRTRSIDGTLTHERGLFEVMTWDELREKRSELVRNMRALKVDVHGIDVLLALQERFPEAATPADACAYLGTSVEEYLAADRGAAS